MASSLVSTTAPHPSASRVEPLCCPPGQFRFVRPGPHASTADQTVSVGKSGDEPTATPTNRCNLNDLQASGVLDQSAPGSPVSTTLSSAPHMDFSPPTLERKRASVTRVTGRRNPQNGDATAGRTGPDDARGPGRDAKNPAPVRERNTHERARARPETLAAMIFCVPPGVRARGRDGMDFSHGARTAGRPRPRHRAYSGASTAPWCASTSIPASRTGRAGRSALGGWRKGREPVRRPCARDWTSDPTRGTTAGAAERPRRGARGGGAAAGTPLARRAAGRGGSSRTPAGKDGRRWTRRCWRCSGRA